MNNEKTKKQLSEDDLIRPCTEDIWSFIRSNEDTILVAKTSDFFLYKKFAVLHIM